MNICSWYFLWDTNNRWNGILAFCVIAVDLAMLLARVREPHSLQCADDTFRDVDAAAKLDCPSQQSGTRITWFDLDFEMDTHTNVVCSFDHVSFTCMLIGCGGFFSAGAIFAAQLAEHGCDRYAHSHASSPATHLSRRGLLKNFRPNLIFTLFIFIIDWRHQMVLDRCAQYWRPKIQHFCVLIDSGRDFSGIDLPWEYSVCVSLRFHFSDFVSCLFDLDA